MFDSRKVLRKEKKNDEENDFPMFCCLLKNLGCVWFLKSTKEKNAKENNFLMLDCPIKKFKKIKYK